MHSIWEELRAFAKKHYPQARECGFWATQDCMSLDGVPYIGPYSGGTEGLFVATGFNKWGMTSSMAAAMLLCDLVRGKENPNSAVFSPSKSILHPQLAINGWESAVNLLTPARSAARIWAVRSSGTLRSIAGTVPATARGLQRTASALTTPPQVT